MSIKPPPILAYPLIAALAVLVAAVATITAVVSHQRTELSKLRAHYIQLTQADQGQTAETIQTTIAHADELAQLVPASDDVTAMLSKMSHDLTNLGATDQQTQTSKPNGAGPVREIPIEVRFVSDYAAVAQVLASMKQYDRLIRVNDLLLQRDPSGASSRVWVNLKMSAFAGDLKEALP